MKKVLRTVAAIAASMAMVNPVPVTATETATNQNQTQESSQNKKAVQQDVRRGQGITISRQGGLDFEHHKMFAQPNPIYFPKRHNKMTWREQSRKAKQRKRTR
jgi:hypothetical protein